MNLKTHFAHLGCGRGKRTTENVWSVDCGACKNKPLFQRALDTAKEAREAAFHAQEPRTVSPAFCQLNDDGVLACFHCQGVLWRERPRSLWSYHFVCANCGNSCQPMTETGMCT